MFENSSVFILGKDNAVYLLEIDEGLRNEILQLFSIAKVQMVDNKEKIEFDGSYIPNSDECLYISNYKLADEILDAIRVPIGTEFFKKYNGSFPEIKAIFVGEKIERDDKEVFSLAFQLFRRDQRLKKTGINLFYHGSTFKKENDYGFNISKSIECYFEGDSLYFSSFYFARQIFDLKSYYRTATNREVDEFLSNEQLSFERKEVFVNQANTWVRRRIAIINDSKVLKNYTVEIIARMAKEKLNQDFEIKEGKLVIPCNKDKMKAILGFLDEEAYQGPFTNTVYLANSKRKMKTLN